MKRTHSFTYLMSKTLCEMVTRMHHMLEMIMFIVIEQMRRVMCHHMLQIVSNFQKICIEQAYFSNTLSHLMHERAKTFWINMMVSQIVFYFLPLHQKIILTPSVQFCPLFRTSFLIWKKPSKFIFFILTFVHIGMPRINMKKHNPTVKSFLCFNKVLG